MSIARHLKTFGYVKCNDAWLPHDVIEKIMNCISTCDSLIKHNSTHSVTVNNVEREMS